MFYLSLVSTEFDHLGFEKEPKVSFATFCPKHHRCVVFIVEELKERFRLGVGVQQEVLKGRRQQLTEKVEIGVAHLDACRIQHLYVCVCVCVRFLTFAQDAQQLCRKDAKLRPRLTNVSEDRENANDQTISVIGAGNIRVIFTQLGYDL